MASLHCRTLLKTETVLPTLPAEWETQAACLLTWPHKNSDWKDSLEKIEFAYLQLAKSISQFQSLIIICFDEKQRDVIRTKLSSRDSNPRKIYFVIAETNDTWCRDYGPLLTRQQGKIAVNDFQFNAWCGKYAYDLDNAINALLLQQGVFPKATFNSVDFILEGGSIDTDGKGTFLSTSQCLLTRHPHKSRSEIEGILKHYLGCQRLLWLEHGQLSGDDTNSHIDNLARFINAKTILHADCQNKSHPDFFALQAMRHELRQFTTASGEPYQLIPVPIPGYQLNNQYLPASYINFLMVNDAVLLPQFGVREDMIALDVFRQCFPDRRIIGIHSSELIQQRGGIHCASMQIPAGTLFNE